MEFSIHSEANVILELLMNGELPMNGEMTRILSSWDLEGVKSFLEVAIPICLTFVRASNRSFECRDLTPGK